MATPGALITAVADASGIPAASLAVYDRHLRAAGLRTKGGRGRGAAQVTARDVATLLVAILGSGELVTAPGTVRRYLQARPHPARTGKALYGALGLSELDALPATHSFVDALEAIIASAVSGDLAQIMSDRGARSRTRAAAAAPILEVAALTPGTVGDIRVAGLPNQATAAARYVLPSPFDKASGGRSSTRTLKAWASKVRRDRSDTDLEQYRRLSARTILAAAAAIRPKEEAQ